MGIEVDESLMRDFFNSIDGKSCLLRCVTVRCVTVTVELVTNAQKR